MLTLGSRFKARLQVRQNIFSSRFLWNFAISLCFFLVFQEAEIHSAGLQPSISMYDFTLFASSGSHRHTSLQNPLPEAMAIIFHCIHFLPILISPSHPCHSQLPPRRIPFRGRGHYWSRPPPRRRPPAAAGPRCRGRCLLPSAATWSLGAAAEVADAEGPVSCMVRWFFMVFPSETMSKGWKNLCWSGHRFGLDWETRKFNKLSLYWKISLTTLQSWAVGKLCAALFYPAKAFIQNCLTVKGYSWWF